MLEVYVDDEALQKAASEGMDEFITLIHDRIMDAIHGEITPETMSQMNADQITLLAYVILRDEVMNGGFIQLIVNGYGSFIYLNPFAAAMKAWGIDGLRKIISQSHKYYAKNRAALEQDFTMEAFHALYEQYPEFDDFDDAFIENEEDFTADVATYVDEHIDQFVKIRK